MRSLVRLPQSLSISLISPIRLPIRLMTRSAKWAAMSTKPGLHLTKQRCFVRMISGTSTRKGHAGILHLQRSDRLGIFQQWCTSDIMADSFPAIVIPAEEEDFFRYTTKRWLWVSFLSQRILSADLTLILVSTKLMKCPGGTSGSTSGPSSKQP
jgi:hypothetical protein